MSDGGSHQGGRAIGNRGPELAVAALLLALALVVISDSWRLGARWGDDGPGAGYFPFYIGLALAGASLAVLLRTLWQWRSDAGTFAARDQLKRVAAVLVPTATYIALIALVGIYVASAALIAWFMTLHGTHRWWVSAAVAVGVPVLVFLVFERWFHVLLPKGPLERLLGL